MPKFVKTQEVLEVLRNNLEIGWHNSIGLASFEVSCASELALLEDAKQELLDAEKSYTNGNDTDCYAFWSYDMFPYCRGGKVAKFVTDGRVQLSANWDNRVVAPIVVVPIEQGLRMKDVLDTLTKDHREQRVQLDAKFKKQAEDVLTFKNKCIGVVNNA